MDAQVIVPALDAVVVEYPAFVREPDKAIARLGGLKAISAAAETDAQKAAELSLTARPHDLLAHPIVGDRVPAKGLILRIRRQAAPATNDASAASAGAPGPGGNNLEVSAVARVDAAFQFTSLADFQYTSTPSAAPLQQQQQQQQQSAQPIGWDPEPLLTVPPVFSRIDTPSDYSFRSFFGGDPDAYKAGMGGQTAGRMASHVVSFNTVQVPGPWSAHGERADAGLSLPRRQLLKQLQARLDDRPLWTAAELADQCAAPHATLPALPPVEAAAVPASLPASAEHSLPSAADMDVLLPRIAYLFRNGPWQGLWTKRGYDPRLDDSARKWQALQYIKPAAWYTHSAVEGLTALSPQQISACTAANTEQVYSFAGIPAGATTTLQVGCFHDATMQAVISARASRQQQCDVKTGWFTQKAWDKLVDQLDRRFKVLVDGTLARLA
ncbi:hypothetical protein WJX73_009274 [Symbiochloris irregularis]|uniref:Transcription factor IIIC subunit 5 HTH domain-containing protein n=1 Tax=Symbiochloris irregularis TaxID=706552 RepID=A0AAW1NZT9_9CHLO